MAKLQSRQNPSIQALPQRDRAGRASKYSAFAETNDYRYTKGKEFTTQQGDEYIGEYHVTSEGVAYTGPTMQKDSLQPRSRLLPYYANQDHFTYDKSFGFYPKPKSFRQPVPYVYVPIESEGVYLTGYDFRYFVQRHNSDSFAIEINGEQFNNIGKDFGIDNAIYAFVAVRWKLTGTLEFIEQTNKTNINIATQQLPALPYSISSYTQFARPTAQDTENNEDSDYIRPQFKRQVVPIKKTYDPSTGRILPNG